MATPMTADQMLTALRAEGVVVHEHIGWRTHERDSATGKPFGPVYGVLIHHTAGINDKEVCYNGRSDLPGPLCHAWLGDTEGLWMISAGRANHAGSGDADVVHALIAEAALPHDNQANYDGNDSLYGLEIENLGDGRDPYSPAQYADAVRWAAAICRHHGWSEKSVAGHKEFEPGKIDPSFDMDTFRADVRKQLAVKPAAPNPPAKPSVDLSNLVAAAKADPRAAQGHALHPADVKPVEAALKAEGLLNSTYASDGSFGTLTVAAYAAWQRKCGYTGTAADGIPGSASLARLAAKHGFTVKA